MNTQDAIQIARKHVGNGAAMESSARLCLTDAIEFAEAGKFDLAKTSAARSLKYSVGIFHADYQRVAKHGL